MRFGGILPVIDELIRLPSSRVRIEKKCNLVDLEINKEICNNSKPTNEGHPTLLCGNFISHIVTDINKLIGIQHVNFEIFPVVKEETDNCENKFSDYSIYRIYNKVTYIIIEVKLAVGAILTTADKDYLAQLFLEAHYVYGEERSTQHNSMLCVLTDGTTWHLIKTDVGRKPFKFISLRSISTKTEIQWDTNLNAICDECTAYVSECML